MRKPARPGDPKKNKCGVANSGCRFDGWLFFYLRALALNMSQLNQGFGRILYIYIIYWWNHNGDTPKVLDLLVFPHQWNTPMLLQVLGLFRFWPSYLRMRKHTSGHCVFFMFFVKGILLEHVIYIFFAVIDSMQAVVCLQMDNLEFHGYLKTLGNCNRFPWNNMRKGGMSLWISYGYPNTENDGFKRHLPEAWRCCPAVCWKLWWNIVDGRNPAPVHG